MSSVSFHRYTRGSYGKWHRYMIIKSVYDIMIYQSTVSEQQGEISNTLSHNTRLDTHT